MPYLNTTEAADHLGIEIDQLRQLRHDGRLMPAGYRNGNQPFYDPRDLDAFAEKLGFQRTHKLPSGDVITVLDDEGLKEHLDQ